MHDINGTRLECGLRITHT